MLYPNVMPSNCHCHYNAANLVKLLKPISLFFLLINNTFSKVHINYCRHRMILLNKLLLVVSYSQKTFSCLYFSGYCVLFKFTTEMLLWVPIVTSW